LANKYYNSRTWLTRRINHDKKSPEEIAKECGVSHMTIYRKMKEFGLK
jgi:transcriptional regulator of acetoin/glycerol metabolism